MSSKDLVKKLVLINISFLFLGLAWRLGFLFLFGNTAELTQNLKDIPLAFLLGSRFDFTVLCYINSVPLLYLTIWFIFKHQLSKFILWPLYVWYLIWLSIMTFFNLIDLGFYSFFQDRLNVLVFGFFEDDTWALVKTMWKNYPVIWMISGLLGFGFILNNLLLKMFIIPKTEKEASSRLILVSIFFILFVINGIGARGSLTLFPLSEMDTGISKNPFINQLCFNSARSFARAFELRLQTKSEWNSNLKYFGYVDHPNQAFADYFNISLSEVPANPIDLLQTQLPLNSWAETKKPHVILVLMESWGSYWMQFNNPSFDLVGPFSHHQKEDFYTNQVLSQTPATIGTLSALMAGVPHRYIGEFLSESKYLQTPFRTSPARIYKKNSYKTRFIYGGNPGWREINKFASFQGYDSVEGESEISNYFKATLEKHDWGIYDGDLWRYVQQTLLEATEPQFIVIMTTSNHPPFQVPISYKAPQFEAPEFVKAKYIGDKSIPNKRFTTYRYALDMFSNFMTDLKKSPLASKTILAATGDHAFWMINFTEAEQLQKNAVPLYIYLPKEIRKNKAMPKFASQIDVLPSLYNLSLSNQIVMNFGQNLFSNNIISTHGSGRLVLGPSGGVAPGPENYYYDWEENNEKLVDGIVSPEKQMMALKYKSLMSILDIYMRQEK